MSSSPAVVLSEHQMNEYDFDNVITKDIQDVLDEKDTL